MWLYQVSCQNTIICLGNEKVIVFGLVPANRRGDVSFVADWRRPNVALMRAKRLCVVISASPSHL